MEPLLANYTLVGGGDHDGDEDGDGGGGDGTKDGDGAKDGDVATDLGGGDGGSGSVYDYTHEVLSMGLLYLHFKNAVREGDGTRVMLAWKYFLLFFKATKHKNFVNVHVFPGCNISADLHMEHMNRIVKTTIAGLGANKTDKVIIRAGKSVGSHCKNGLVKLTNHWLPQFHLLFSLFIYREARRSRTVL